MTKQYYVEVPIAGMIGVSVEAEGEDQAKVLAMEATLAAKLDWDNNDAPSKTEIVHCEWDSYEKLVEGNVCYTYHTDINVEEE